MKSIIAIISVLVLISLTGPASAETKYTYDASGKILEARDFDSNGNQIEARGFDYDSNGRLTKIRKLIGDKIESIQQTNFIYDDTKNTIAITDSRGKTTTIQKDSNGKITQVIFPDGKAVSWTYNDHGKVSSIRNPSGGFTRIFYDCNGKISQIFDKTNREMRIIKDRAEEVISIDQEVIVPGTLTFELEIHLDGFKPFNQVLGLVDLFPGKSQYAEFAFENNYGILNKVPGKEISQEDWDNALNRQIEVLKNDVKTQNPYAYIRYPSLEKSLIQSLTHKSRDELLDRLIKENPDLKPGLQKIKSGEDWGRDLKLDIDIKREYDSKGRLMRIVTPWGKNEYEYNNNTNIPSSVTSISKKDPAEEAEKLKYEKDRTGKVQAITHQKGDDSITHDALTGQYITGNKDLEKKYDYDLRGFPTEPDKSFITLPGGILPEPTAQKPSINKLHFTADGKTYTKDTSGKLVEVIDGFVRDSSGKPVVATGIEIVRPAEKDPIRDLDLGADRLAAISESGDPLALYTQTNDGLIETKATDGSSLYLHVDAYGKVVEVKNKRGKTLNKFTYDPSSEELYSETIHELLQEDLNNIYKLGANNLGKLMELAMGVAPASLVYDESDCEKTIGSGQQIQIECPEASWLDRNSCACKSLECENKAAREDNACVDALKESLESCESGCYTECEGLWKDTKCFDSKCYDACKEPIDRKVEACEAAYYSALNTCQQEEDSCHE